MTDSPRERPERLRIGPWCVLPPLNRIEDAAGNGSVLEPKVMRVLLCLAERPGQVRSREEILAAVWPGEHVTDNVLSRSISELRRAFGDDHRDPRFIETIRKSGFRLIAPVHVPAEHEPPPAVRSHRPGRWTIGLAGAATLALLFVAAFMRNAERGRTAPSMRDSGLPLRVTSFRGSELDPALSFDGRRLAFAWNGPGGDNFDIYVRSVPADLAAPSGGAAPLRLTEHPGEDKNPAWAPDGEQIAFVRSARGAHGIYVVPLLGGSERKLADCVSGDIPDLVWSTDGRYLFFPDRESVDEPSGIFRLDVATLKKRRITRPSHQLLGDRDLTVSPDGRHVAFARAVMVGVEDLYVASVADGATRRLTFDGSSIAGLEWLPETNSILFSTARDGTARLWHLSPTGGTPTRLVELGDDAYDPSFARQSRRLVFERRPYDTSIWRLDLTAAADDLPARDPSSPRRFISSTRWDSSPTIAPDGSHVAFVSDRTGTRQIWVCDRAGSAPRRLTHVAPGAAGNPAWSPDGTSVVYTYEIDGQSDLYLIPLGGTPPRRLTSSSWRETAPSFSHDGQSIYFGSDQNGRWQIWRLRIDGGDAVQITRGGGIRAVESPTGDGIYYARHDHEGIWHVASTGGTEELVFTPEQRMHWGDWTIAEGRIYFRTLESSPLDPTSLYAYDVDRSRTTLIYAAIGGRTSPGLGLTVAPDSGYLLLASIDNSDGDIMLVENFR